MKRNIFKSFGLFTLVMASFALVGCEEVLEQILEISIDKWADLVNEKEHETIIEGNTLTYGSHSYSVEGDLDATGMTGRYDTPTASVSFTNIPSGYNEFKAVYNGLLGNSIQGTAAMIPMAIEIYARNSYTGERCLKLLCHDESTVKEILSVLKERFKINEYGGENDPYIQRYLPAALLKGATPKNAYRPSEPYMVEMCPSVNKPQSISSGIDNFVYILCKGWDTGGYNYAQRQVEIIQPKGGGLYKVFSCPSTYVQCKEIVGTWKGLK